jgi:uncharacterized protein with ParB-like and HNH nuclease domain
MQSDTMSIQSLFQDRRQYRVPFFQRAYVWNKEEQWEPLWIDISAKAEIRFGGDQPSPHFLGATVLEPQHRTGLMGVETLHIIDGQQRLTTLQYFLSALSIVLRAENQNTLLSVIGNCLRNTNTDTMQNPETEIFKVWPTFRDRRNYQLAMDSASLDELRERFPQSFTQSATLKKIGIDHPPALESIWYFSEQISEWISQDGQDRKLDRLNALSEAILRDLCLVSISLGDQDDAQIIFETLNGRGAQLHATDLIRNFIFMRADREGTSAAQLYDTLWSPLESEFWAQSQRRGRLSRPRLEWFLQTTLQAILGDEVEIGRLYAAYRGFAQQKDSPRSAEQQLRLLDKHSTNYRQLISGSGEAPIATFGRRTLVWDASTTHSLALTIADSELSHEQQTEMFNYLASYLVRRAICGLTTKNYNKIFLQQLKKLAAAELSPASLRASLAELDGDASRWPSNDEFRVSWLTGRAYRGRLDAARAKAILAEIETGMRSARSEEPILGALENLDVDHILPTQWFEHWPLPDGTAAQETEARDVNLLELLGEPITERLSAIARREAAKVTMGNLTLLHYGVNRGLQHREFSMKREKMFEESNLHLNRSLMQLGKWDETDIAHRGQMLFDIAASIWGGPS